MPIIFAFLGLIFACIAAFSCHSFEVEAGPNFDRDNYAEYSGCQSDWSSPLILGKGNSGGFGLWNVELLRADTRIEFPFIPTTTVTRECRPWSDIDGCYDVDAPLRTGQAIGVIVTVFASLIIVLTMVALCVVLPKWLWHTAGGIEIALAVITPFLFLGLATEFCDEADLDCTPSSAVYMSVPATVFLAVAGVSMLFVRERRPRGSTKNVDARTHETSTVPPPPVNPVTLPYVEAIPMEQSPAAAYPLHTLRATAPLPEQSKRDEMAPSNLEFKDQVRSVGGRQSY